MVTKEMIFYRYHDGHFTNGILIEESKFILLRETPSGYWIIPDYMFHYMEHDKDFADRMTKRSRRWISKTSRKRYAYPTKQEALENLIARKKRQAEHSAYYLDRSKTALSMAKDMLEKIKEPSAA